ncbi:MAG TPA: hypothetical protein VJ508_14815 [Saprospiraceae bacterium]|nr:hypothetical protein [Saprospiraceae bacterium]
MDPRYLARRPAIEQFFTPENHINEPPAMHRSPSGRYDLEISKYHTKPKSWDYSRGVVKHIESGAVIADIKRNYGVFLHSWVNHQNGFEYLLCGEDYQGYSVINLVTGVHHRYFPEQAYAGGGFCWAAVSPSPDGLVLAVEGCVWACPYDLVVYDFANPEQLPLPELARIENIANCSGWKDNSTFIYERSFDVRASDGTPFEQLSEEEVDRLYKIPNGFSCKKTAGEWRRTE